MEDSFLNKIENTDIIYDEKTFKDFVNSNINDSVFTDKIMDNFKMKFLARIIFLVK